MGNEKPLMQPDEQWVFEVLVYSSGFSSPGMPRFSASIMPTSGNPLAECLNELSGHGKTPALAVADLFRQANEIMDRES